MTIGKAEFARDLAWRAHSDWFRARNAEEPVGVSAARYDARARERAEFIKLGIPPPQDEARFNLLRFISTLPDGARTDLIALRRLGRGDHDTFEQAREVAGAAVARQSGLEAATYLAAEAPLADYLNRGLLRLQGRSQEPAGPHG